MSPARAAVLATALLVVLYLISLAVVEAARRSLSQLPVLAELPEVVLVRATGEPIRSEDLLGRLRVVSVLPAGCPDPCPAVLERLRRLQGSFTGSGEVGLVSLVEIERGMDASQELAALEREYTIPPRGWLLLGGAPDATAVLESALFDRGSTRTVDRERTLVLLDQDGRVRGRYDGLDEASIKVLSSHVRELARR